MRKNYCILVTDHELDSSDVEEFFDVVDEVAQAKIITGHTTDSGTVDIEVTVYHNDNKYGYEIVLNKALTLSEGERISDILNEIFEFDFDFEINVDID